MTNASAGCGVLRPDRSSASPSSGGPPPGCSDTGSGPPARDGEDLANARTRLDALIESETAVEDVDKAPDTTPSAFSLLKSDPGRIGQASFQREVAKLNRIWALDLPDGLWADAGRRLYRFGPKSPP